MKFIKEIPERLAFKITKRFAFFPVRVSLDNNTTVLIWLDFYYSLYVYGAYCWDGYHWDLVKCGATIESLSEYYKKEYKTDIGLKKE